MKWGHTLDEKEKEFIERQIQLALSGCPEYEVPGDEDTDPQGPLLEKYPHQQLLKLYLIRHGHLEFRKRRFLKDKAFNVLGARGNIAWCCDPDCRRGEYWDSAHAWDHAKPGQLLWNRAEADKITDLGEIVELALHDLERDFDTWIVNLKK